MSTAAALSPPVWQAALKLGVPAVIALGLVFWLTQIVSSDMRTMSSDVRATHSAVERHVDDMKSDAAIERALLRAICFNVSSNDAQRALCEVGRR